MIKQAFLHVDVVGPHVQEGHYDLIGPTGEIILPQVWESMVAPGWSLSMHMWPMPEPKPYPPGPIPGQHFHPSSRDRYASSRGPPPGPPPSTHRWGAGPPPPSHGWPGPGGPPPRPHPGRNRGGLSGSPIMGMKPGSPSLKARHEKPLFKPSEGMSLQYLLTQSRPGWNSGPPASSLPGWTGIM